MSLFFLALAALAALTILMTAANLTQGAPLRLSRTRETSLILYGCLALALATGPGRAGRFRAWLAAARNALAHRSSFRVLLASMGVLYLLTVISQHLSFRTFSHDFSMIDQALYASHHGRFLYSPVLGRHFFSEHFSPILIPLVPLHALWPSPWLLILLQPAALLAAGVLLRRILIREGHPEWVANLGMLAWLGNPVVARSLRYLSHMENVLPALLFGMWLAYRSRRNLAYWALVLAALAVKEDVGLYLAGFGAWAFVADRRRGLGCATFAAGLIWTALAVRWVIPHFAGGQNGYPFMGRWSQWGDGILGVPAGFLTGAPSLLAALLGSASLRLFGSLLFLPFLTRWGWIAFSAPWVLNVTSGHAQQAHLSLYYGIPLLSFAVLAAIRALDTGAARRWMTSRWAPAVPIALVALNFSHFTFPAIDRTRPRFVAALRSIPRDASVQAMSCFYPVLGYDRVLRLVGGSAELTEPYAVLRTHSTTWPLTPDRAKSLLEEAVAGRRYEILAEVNGAYLLRRGSDD